MLTRLVEATQVTLDRRVVFSGTGRKGAKEVHEQLGEKTTERRGESGVEDVEEVTVWRVEGSLEVPKSETRSVKSCKVSVTYVSIPSRCAADSNEIFSGTCSPPEPSPALASPPKSASSHPASTSNFPQTRLPPHDLPLPPNSALPLQDAIASRPLSPVPLLPGFPTLLAGAQSTSSSLARQALDVVPPNQIPSSALNLNVDPPIPQSLDVVRPKSKPSQADRKSVV